MTKGVTNNKVLVRNESLEEILSNMDQKFQALQLKMKEDLQLIMQKNIQAMFQNMQLKMKEVLQLNIEKNRAAVKAIFLKEFSKVKNIHVDNNIPNVSTADFVAATVKANEDLDSSAGVQIIAASFCETQETCNSPINVFCSNFVKTGAATKLFLLPEVEASRNESKGGHLGEVFDPGIKDVNNHR